MSRYRSIAAILLLATLALPAAAGEDASEPSFSVSASDDVVAPGETIDITIELRYSGSAPLTNISIFQSLPAGWSLNAVVSDNLADVSPAAGAAGELEWRWNQPSAFPVRLTYRALAGDFTCATITGNSSVELGEVERSRPIAQIDFFASESAAVSLTRSVAGGGFTPGQSVDISLTIGKGCPANFSAIGVEEALPSGWTVDPINPFVGEAFGADAVFRDGVLEIFWITIPAVPITVTYRAQVAAGAPATAQISGTAIARYTGQEIASDPVVTTLGAGTGEGEGEGEGEGAGEGEGEGEGAAEGEGEGEGEGEMKAALLGCSCGEGSGAPGAGELLVLLGAVAVLSSQCRRVRKTH